MTGVLKTWPEGSAVGCLSEGKRTAATTTSLTSHTKGAPPFESEAFFSRRKYVETHTQSSTPVAAVPERLFSGQGVQSVTSEERYVPERGWLDDGWGMG